MRRITIELAEDTTDRRCGSCQHQLGSIGVCRLFGDVLGGRHHNSVRLDLCLAILAINGERDRKLGAAVRAAVKAHEDAHQGAFGIEAIADDIGHDTNYMPHVEGARILRAIAAALREEDASDR